MKRQLSRKKRIAFRVVMILLIWMMVEFTSLVIHRVYDGAWFRWSTAQAERQKVTSLHSHESTPDFATGPIHPYLGFTGKPSWDPDGDSTYPFLWEEEQPQEVVRGTGWYSRQRIVQQRSEETVLVGITGGSVGRIYYRQGIHHTLNALRDHPEFKGKRFVVINLAMGGYKQPQQLMALTYLLAQGGELDILINIDGFNEVALHSTENAVKGVFPLYPRSWYFRAGQVADSTTLRLIGRCEVVRANIVSTTNFFCSRPLSLSPTCNLIWRARTKMLEKNLAELVDLVSRTNGDSSFAATGPPFSPQTESELYQFLAQSWEECSRQMNFLCKANNIRYNHFLQPNQYLPDSKPMSDAEQRVAIRDDHPYRQGVLKGYHLLQEAGQQLQSEGIAFVDLTKIFEDVKDPIYSDDCCHFAAQGNQIMASHIARSILSGE